MSLFKIVSSSSDNARLMEYLWGYMEYYIYLSLAKECVAQWKHNKVYPVLLEKQLILLYAVRYLGLASTAQIWK